MPRETDCPVCENTGVLLDGDICMHCKGTGLLKLYTEEEFQEVLDALILTNISLSYIQSGKPGKLYLNNIAVIEKVTGKLWEEMK